MNPQLTCEPISTIPREKGEKRISLSRLGGKEEKRRGTVLSETSRSQEEESAQLGLQFPACLQLRKKEKPSQRTTPAGTDKKNFSCPKKRQGKFTVHMRRGKREASLRGRKKENPLSHRESPFTEIKTTSSLREGGEHGREEEFWHQEN